MKSLVLENILNILYGRYVVMEQLPFVATKLLVGASSEEFEYSADNKEETFASRSSNNKISYKSKGKFSIGQKSTMTCGIDIDGKYIEISLGRVGTTDTIFVNGKVLYCSSSHWFSEEAAELFDRNLPLAKALDRFVACFNKLIREFGREDLVMRSLAEHKIFIIGEDRKPLKTKSKKVVSILEGKRPV